MAWYHLGDHTRALYALSCAFANNPIEQVIQRALVGILGEFRELKARADLWNELLTSDAVDVAVQASRNLDPSWAFTGRLHHGDGRLRGWAAWHGDSDERQLIFEAGGQRIGSTVRRTSFLLESNVSIGNFDWPFPKQIAVLHARDGETGLPLQGSPVVYDEALAEPRLCPQLEDPDVTVIVPVYGDPESLQICLESMMEDHCQTRRRIIAVDDASPQKHIKEILAEFERERALEVINNPANLGFARSVNRALRLTGSGDVVVLNSDTIVPEGWLDKLHILGRDPKIGTITALSNNGELTSVPRKFAFNALGSLADINRIDAALTQRVSGGTVVDMPHGVGHCLYICRRALDAVPKFSASYGRGYFEDVDFGLTVAAHGLRNVCATNVYVGHKGTTSFGQAKRGLIKKNARILRERWADIDAKTDAWLASDPLASIRGQVAFAALRDGRPKILFLCEELPEAWLWGVMRGLAGEGRPIAVLRNADASLLFQDENGTAFRWPEDCPDLHVPDVLYRLSGTQCIAVDLHPIDVDSWMATLGPSLSIDLFITRPWSANTPTERRTRNKPWQRIRHVLCPNKQAASFVNSLGTGSTVRVLNVAPWLVDPETLAPCELPEDQEIVERRICIISVDDPDTTFRQCRALLAKCSNVFSFVLFGTTSDDEALMGDWKGAFFVTGPVYSRERDYLLSLYASSRMIVLAEKEVYLHPALALVPESGLPVFWPDTLSPDLCNVDVSSVTPYPARDISALASLLLSPARPTGG